MCPAVGDTERVGRRHTWVPPYRGISKGAVKRGVGEIGKAPPVAEEASRFRGSAPIDGHDSGRESVGTTVGNRRPLQGHGWGCGAGGRGRTPPLRGGWECGAGVLRIATPACALVRNDRIFGRCEACQRRGCGHPALRIIWKSLRNGSSGGRPLRKHYRECGMVIMAKRNGEVLWEK